MQLQNYSVQELIELIKANEKKYYQALKEDRDFEYVKEIYLKIKELKKILLLKQTQSVEFLN